MQAAIQQGRFGSYQPECRPSSPRGAAGKARLPARSGCDLGERGSPASTVTQAQLTAGPAESQQRRPSSDASGLGPPQQRQAGLDSAARAVPAKPQQQPAPAARAVAGGASPKPPTPTHSGEASEQASLARGQEPLQQQARDSEEVQQAAQVPRPAQGAPPPRQASLDAVLQMLEAQRGSLPPAPAQPAAGVAAKARSRRKAAPHSSALPAAPASLDLRGLSKLLVGRLGSNKGAQLLIPFTRWGAACEPPTSDVRTLLLDFAALERRGLLGCREGTVINYLRDVGTALRACKEITALLDGRQQAHLAAELERGTNEARAAFNLVRQRQAKRSGLELPQAPAAAQAAAADAGPASGRGRSGSSEPPSLAAAGGSAAGTAVGGPRSSRRSNRWQPGKYTGADADWLVESDMDSGAEDAPAAGGGRKRKAGDTKQATPQPEPPAAEQEPVQVAAGEPARKKARKQPAPRSGAPPASHARRASARSPPAPPAAPKQAAAASGKRPASANALPDPQPSSSSEPRREQAAAAEPEPGTDARSEPASDAGEAEVVSSGGGSASPRRSMSVTQLLALVGRVEKPGYDASNIKSTLNTFMRVGDSTDIVALCLTRLDAFMAFMPSLSISTAYLYLCQLRRLLGSPPGGPSRHRQQGYSQVQALFTAPELLQLQQRLDEEREVAWALLKSTESAAKQTPSARLLAADPAAIVGRRLEVFWPLDNAWYGGSIEAFHAEGRKHTLRYDDGDREVVVLSRQQWRLTDLTEAERVPARICMPAPAALGAAAEAPASPLDAAAAAARAAANARAAVGALAAAAAAAAEGDGLASGDEQASEEQPGEEQPPQQQCAAGEGAGTGEGSSAAALDCDEPHGSPPSHQLSLAELLFCTAAERVAAAGPGGTPVPASCSGELGPRLAPGSGPGSTCDSEGDVEAAELLVALSSLATGSSSDSQEADSPHSQPPPSQGLRSAEEQHTAQPVPAQAQPEHSSLEQAAERKPTAAPRRSGRRKRSASAPAAATPAALADSKRARRQPVEADADGQQQQPPQ